MMDENSRYGAWFAVFMMFLFMLINFADKAVIGLSAVQIIDELHLTHTQFGLLGSSFFLLFSASGIVVGFLSDRIKAKNVVLGMALIWSIAQLPMIGAVSFTTLLASRVLLGAGEGPAFPMAMHVVYKWFEDKRRTVPTSIVACGAAFGAGVVAPGATWIIVHFGWHMAFGVLSVVGVAWSLAWLAFGKEGPLSERHQTAEDAVGRTGPSHVPFRELLLCRTAIGVFVAGFAAYWALTLNVTWLAAYLIKGAHLTASQAGWVIVLPSATQIVLAPTIAFISQRLITRGFSSRFARGTVAGGCVLAGGLAMICLPLAPLGAVAIVCIALAFSVGSIVFTLGSTLVAEISPSSQRGAMLGTTNSIHTLAGLVAPVAMGTIVDLGRDATAGFVTGFITAGAAIAVAGIIAIFLIDPERDIARFKHLYLKTIASDEPLDVLDPVAH
jgi:MFS family permease